MPRAGSADPLSLKGSLHGASFLVFRSIGSERERYRDIARDGPREVGEGVEEDGETEREKVRGERDDRDVYL